MKSDEFIKSRRLSRGFALLWTSSLPLLFMASEPAMAVVPEDLYIGTVDVTGTPPAEAELVRAAFAAMLVKLTDPSSVAEARAAPPGEAELRSMVLSMVYLDVAPSTVMQPPAAGRARIVTRFEPAAVEAWLMRRGLPRWQPERRRWRLWLVFDEMSGRRLPGAEDSEVEALLRRVAGNFGLPVEIPGATELPAAGSAEAEQLIAAIHGGYPEDPIFDQASATTSAGDRTPLASPLLITARPIQDGWQVRWRALDGNELIAFAGGEARLETALETGLGRFAGEIARRHLLRETQVQKLVVEVIGIDGPDDVGEALSRLGDLSQVESLAVTRAFGDRLTLELKARAGPDWLRSALRLETDWLEQAEFEQTEFEQPGFNQPVLNQPGRKPTGAEPWRMAPATGPLRYRIGVF